MLSRVADSLYWMSRYFERADHCARVLETTYNLLLNPFKSSREQRWNRITSSLGLPESASTSDAEAAMMWLITKPGNKASIVSCIAGARDNASQVREQISSEMWERLNRLYHQVNSSTASAELGTEMLRLLAGLHDDTYRFYGVTDCTMNRSEGWYFIQLGKYMERACALSLLLDAHFASSAGADDLDWIGLLTSCSALEAYRKVYTADLTANRVAEFLILNAEFPYSVRYSAESMRSTLEAIGDLTSARKTTKVSRTIGKLHSSLAYAQIEEVMASNVHSFLNSILEQCHRLHFAVHEIYTDYSIEATFDA